ncbi:Crp/Fnr family transcriptional regulator [Pedobacter hiemivivus]|uniref:Crp/Fnr family transcriptional regulator n=1 Tax=Pedobacter hiemivivus TaxID=2530454 RepID=A0A4U1GL75_9SPHI|nr:Crp/Fnr family transcriptional regulator [Pedobacter hiemivivus]TKC64988.1 Crp/Fnr family transcriptional regulator [Pedobacter hiemivivus]
MKNQMISKTTLQVFREGLTKFVTFSDAEWVELTPYLRASSIKKKDHFVVHGKVCKHIGFVIKGSLRFYHVKDGTEITGYFCFENEFVSSYKSYLKQELSLTGIQAMEDTELILIAYEDMQQLLAHPKLAFKMEQFGRLIAEYYICCYEDRMAAFIVQSPEERYLSMIENQAGILLRIPQHYVANFLGITPVSLSRIRKRTLRGVVNT